MAALDPELDVAATAMVAESARFVVVGGFAVIANRFVRATEDIDFLVPDSVENDRRVVAALRKLDGMRLRDEAPLRDEHLIGHAHLRATTHAGIVDVLRGGLPPLDYDTVEKLAVRADYGEVQFLVAGLNSIVGFKRLADRPRDAIRQCSKYELLVCQSNRIRPKTGTSRLHDHDKYAASYGNAEADG